MHRPCAFTAIALVTGTVAGNYIKPPLLPVFLIVIGFAVAFAMLRRVHRVRMFLLFGVIAFAGAAYLGLRTPVAENNDIGVWVEKGPRKASFSGTILNPLTRVESGKGKIRYRFDLAVETLHADSKSITVSGIVRVYITNCKEQPGFQPGDMVEALVDATLYPAPRPTNPGQVDYSSYYLRRSISARSYVREGTLRTVRKAASAWYRRVFFAVRKRILSSLEDSFADEEDRDGGNLLCAMLVGEREALGVETKELYLKTGTFHFLALSGLHVAIFGFFLWYLLALLPVPRNVRICLVMAGLVCYCAIGGASISLVRATVMGLLYLGAELFWRQRDTINIIGTAAIIVIIINPLDVFSLGFQFSFVAVLSIAAFGPVFEKLRTTHDYLLLKLQQPKFHTRLDQIRGVLNESFLVWIYVSISAWIGVAPLIAHHFHIVTPFSILINLIISPAIWGLLLMGILTVISSLILPPVAPAFAWLVSLMVAGIQTVLGIFSSGALYFYVPNALFAPVSLLWLIPYYILLAAGAYRLRRPRPRWRYLSAAVLILLSLYILVPWRFHRVHAAKLTALDVGRGSTFVIRTSGGATVLYDCGGGFDRVGRDIIAPYLWHEGVVAVEAVILSHPDADHTCGFADILERFRVGAVIVSAYFDRNDDGRQILAAARDAGVQVKVVRPGEEFETGGARFEILAPTAGESFGRVLSDNDTSLIVRVLDDGASFLFTGDAESRQTAMLLDSGANLEAELLVIPHHGGRNSLVQALIRRSGARFALISGGYRQSRILDELELHNVAVFSTETCGAITVHNNRGIIAPETFLGN